MDQAITNEERVATLTAIHAAERLPKDGYLNVDEHAYRRLRHFLPTSEEIGAAMRGYTVEMSPATAQKVRRAITAQAALLTQWLQTEHKEYEARRINNWTEADQYLDSTEIVLSPLNALALGTIRHYSGEKSTMTLSEKLLEKGGLRRLAATAQHELIHQATQQPDFSPYFIRSLLSMVRFNLSRSSPAAKLVRKAQNLI